MVCSVKCYFDFLKYVVFVYVLIYLICYMVNKVMLCQVDNVLYLLKVVLIVYVNCNFDLNMV